MVDFDFSELKKLAADLGTVPESTGAPLRKAFEVTSRRVKDEAKKSVGSSPHWRGAAAAISYEITTSAGVGGSSIESEIGYDKTKPAGELGNLREFGAPNATYGGKSVPLAPHNDLVNALHANEDDFTKGIEAAIDDALKEAGL